MLTVLALSAGAAGAADISVSDARIAGGKLIVAGTTAAPNTWVRLDGQVGADFNVKSGADGAFAFGVVYHPGDCIVGVQKLISPTALGAITAALVADCGPAGVTPRGAWNRATAYVANDLVTYLGSTWRATRGSANRPPVSGADWELFAAAGEPAPSGDEVVDAPAADTPIGPAGGDLTGTYPNPTLRDQAVTVGKIALGAVSAARLADGAVTTLKIAVNAVTAGRIAANAVTSDKIADGTIVSADLGASSVGSLQLATDAVQASEIADDSIDGGEIIDNSLTAIDLAAGSVGNSELATSAVDSSKVLNNSLTTADIAGADVNGSTITLNAGAVANGRCKDVSVAIGGAKAGEAVVFSIKAALPEGILIYGVRVPSDNIVTAKVCNLSGAAFPQIDNLPVRVITFG